VSDFHPPADYSVVGNDVMAVLGGPHEIKTLASDNLLVR